MSGLRRALAGYGPGFGSNDGDQVDEFRRVHSTAWDRDHGRLHELGPLTSRELRLFKQGGYEAGYRSARYQPSTPTLWIETALDLLRQMR